MTPDLERIEALAKAATEGNLKLNRYNHGGGRLYADDDLIADFYDESNREFYAACSPQTVLALVAEVKRLRKLDIEHVNDASIEDSDIHRLVARVRELEAERKVQSEVIEEIIAECQQYQRWTLDMPDELRHKVIAACEDNLKRTVERRALDGAKGETHGPRCHICHGKGWLNTADQNALEDKGGNVGS